MIFHGSIFRLNTMNRLRDILIIVLLGLQVLWGFYFFKRVYAGKRAEIVNEIGKPYAVLTIDYGEPLKGFQEGEFYVLKVLKIRATSIDYGFCPVKRKVFYAKED